MLPSKPVKLGMMMHLTLVIPMKDVDTEPLVFGCRNVSFFFIAR